MNDNLEFFKDLNESSDDMILEESYKVLNERNIVKMDKITLKKRLLTQSTLLAAKEAKDPIYFKYAKFAKLKRSYRKMIQKKYLAQGKHKMKEFLRTHKALDQANKK